MKTVLHTSLKAVNLSDVVFLKIQ